ncbi:LacI family DNA-binding transcriptional regulator [Amycolatopsis palatopharyngis]|uniref:LacI family DNA-binding transcriptional regulator n=1 Tax=Amycolatopsis palatopharyngis TaxID=187982 RepID=UPI0013BE8BB5|nr:LacI family DNA-binding transcriptional regulator [Amycolatopsis palatopharyngis]
MATIHEVAAKAGVSTATVSRYLRGQKVRSAQAVNAAVAALGYSPNAVAQSLKSGRTGMIGVVVPDVTNPFFAAVAKGLEQVCQGQSFRMLLANSGESAETEQEILADLVHRVDGVILAPATEQDDAPLQLREAGVPAVFLDRELAGDEPFDAVLVDNVGGAHAAAKHLTDLGHTRIAMINGPADTTPGRGRREGFLAGLEEAGIELPPEYDLMGGFQEGTAHQLALQLLAQPEPPTAIFTGNNLMTVGVLKALQDMRVDVPGEVSVLGFDDLTLGSLLRSPLTCIDRPDVEQGALAMRLMLSRITHDTPGAPRRIVLDTQLLVRESTASPRPTRKARR